MRFLVIDDSLADSLVLKALLTQFYGKEIEFVHEPMAEPGLSKALNEPFDCIFLDYLLDDSGNWDFLKRLRDAGSDIPVIAVSGHGSEPVAVESLQLGAQDYLVKSSLTADSVGRAARGAMERVDLARKLALKREDLRHFAHAASHDLQAPLRHIRQLSDFLLQDLNDRLDESSRRYLEEIGQNADRLGHLTRSLIEYARQDEVAVPGREVDLNRVLEQACMNLQLLIDSTDASVEHSSLPHVFGNEATLILLMQNLLSNAIKFHRESPVRVSISVETLASGWQITVEDNGIGIAPDDCETIFTPFRRLHSQQEYEGAGIGLATCRRIVRRHGGKIWVESQLGVGTRMVFTLPQPEPDSEPPSGSKNN